MSILGNLLGTNTTKESMTAYTITEAQRQQLLAATHTHYHKSYELLQSLTPNSGEPVAHGVFHKDGSAHIFQQQSTAQVFGEAQALYLHPAPSTSPSTQEEATALAHRFGTAYTHRSAPGYTAYAFVPKALMDFVRAIEKTKEISDDYIHTRAA